MQTYNVQSKTKIQELEKTNIDDFLQKLWTNI